MYLDHRDIFQALTNMVGDEINGTLQQQLEDILLFDGDVDEFDQTTRNKMAEVLDTMLKSLPMVQSELQGWSEALKGETSGEVDELARRAGL